MTSPSKTSILLCKATRQGQSLDDGYEFKVAVLAKEHYRMDEIVSEALSAAGYTFVHTSDHRHFDETKENDQQTIDLCQQVSLQNPVAFVLISETDQTPTQNYLMLSVHDLPALPDDPTLAFWEKQWIVPELKQPLFAQPDTEQTLHTYLLLDAQTYTQANGIFNLDNEARYPVRCMFKGEAFENNKKAAPYVLDVTLTHEQYQNENDTPLFHQRLFAPLWQLGSGLFIRSYANFDDIHTHLRRFLQLQDSQRKWHFFRYWDPRVARAYFSGIQHCPDRAAKWYGFKNDETVIHSLCYQGQSTEQCIEVKPNTPLLEPSQIALRVDRGLEHDIFLHHSRQKFIAKTLPWLHDTFGEQQFKDQTAQAFLHDQLPTLKTRYRLKSEFALGFALAGCYVLASPIDNIPDTFLAQLDQPEKTEAQRAEAFITQIIQAKNSESLHD